MITIDISLIDRIRNSWETKFGIAGLLFVVNLLILNYSNSIDDYLQIRFFSIAFTVLISLVLFFIWLKLTNRLFIKTSAYISVGVILSVNTEREKIPFSRILRRVINQINDSPDFENIRLRLLPTNFLSSDKRVEKYHRNFGFMYDVILRLQVSSGFFESNEKIELESIAITFTSKGRNGPKRVYYDEVDINKDLKLQGDLRNWDFAFNNSGPDTKKYFENLHFIIVYNVAMYAIYVDKYNEALRALSSIFRSEDQVVHVGRNSGGKNTLKLLPVNLAHGRIATILIDLFFFAANKAYDGRNFKDALNQLEKLETLIKSHPYKFNQLLNMSLFSYYVGDIEKAKTYTLEAEKINGRSLLINLNKGFFAALDSDVEEFCKNYQILFEQRGARELVAQNWVMVLDFQLEQKSKSELLNFSISFIEYVYLKQLPAENFRELITKYKDKEELVRLYTLGTFILSRSKTTQFSNRRKSIKKNRSRRK